MKVEKQFYIPLLLLNVCMILISIYLSILYIKSKSFHTYPCYNMILFSLMVSFVTILRNISFNSGSNCSTFEEYEAFFIIFLEKLIICTLSMQSLIYYLGVVKTKFYYAYEKRIFFITFFISLFISLTLALLFILSFDLEKSGIYCYCQNTKGKNILESIFVTIYLFITLFCTIRVLIYIYQKKKEVKAGLIQDLDYNHHYRRILILFLLNALLFIISYILIIRNDEKYENLIYIVTCFAIDLVNSINRTVYRETLKIFCKKKYEQKYPTLFNHVTTLADDENDSIENEEKLIRSRTDSF